MSEVNAYSSITGFRSFSIWRDEVVRMVLPVSPRVWLIKNKNVIAMELLYRYGAMYPTTEYHM